MILGDVEYVKDFPIQADLGNAEESGYDVIGILNFQVCDTMLMVSLKDGWLLAVLFSKKEESDRQNVGGGART